MKLAKGDMFTGHRSDVLICTGNATIKHDGSVVMGRGAALQMKTLYPTSPRKFGQLVRAEACSGRNYGLIYIDPPQEGDPILGLFQVKRYFKDDADLDLIQHSTSLLLYYAKGRWHDYSISMNFPGIGYGRLQRGSVLSIIEGLPDNVTVWEYQ